VLGIQTAIKDTNFKININGLEELQLTLGSGAILVQAITSSTYRNIVHVGAIELRIRKEDISTLHMRVEKGAIITDNPDIVLSKLPAGGFEGSFQGTLPGQHTELVVGSGVILLKIQ
jgi:hypothetical protein